LESDELMQAVLPTVRADFELCETYVPGEESPFDCPILALGGRDDPRASAADLEAWRAYTRAQFEVLVLPGDHFFIQTQRAAVIAAVARFLEPIRLSASRAPKEVIWHAATTRPPLGDNDVHCWQARLDGGEEKVRECSSTLI